MSTPAAGRARKPRALTRAQELLFFAAAFALALALQLAVLL
jgi:hypothetical protein